MDIDDSDQMHVEEEQLVRFERLAAMPMLILSLLFLGIMLIPLLLHLSSHEQRIIEIVNWIIWSAFAGEFVVRFSLAKRRLHFLRHNLVDFAIVVLPLLRPLRFVRGARSLRLLQTGRLVATGLRGGKEGQKLLTGRSVGIAAGVVISLVIAGAALVYDAEHAAPNGNISSPGSAFWWAVETVSSVGYGDYYPVTIEGRLLATGMMLLGTCLTGLIAAAFTSIFVEQKNEEEFEPQFHELREHLNRLDLILERMEKNINTR